jgi:ABC-2 type transport system permease protein
MKSLLKLTWVELKLFFREPLTMVFTFALPVVFLLVMGGVFGNSPDTSKLHIYRGVGAVNYYNPAYIALVLASIGIVAMPIHLTAYRERRVLKRFHASSLSVWNVIGSQVLVAFVTAIIGSILITVISLIFFKATMPKMWELLIPAFVLATLCFSSLGLLLGAILPNTRAAQGVGLLLFFVMMILGGAGPPREVMSKVMNYVGDATPIWYVIQLLQEPWLGFGWQVNASLIVGGITITATALTVKFFKWD